MNLVAIVGRPNVGKSTLFNRLTESRHAIVHDAPGVTRDRVYGQVIWNGEEFALVDTGGYVPRSADRFERAIREQVEIALMEADIILLVTDTTAGVTKLDEEMAQILRRTDKPVIVAANKADNQQLRWDASSMYTLGLGEVFPVSATNGMGTGEFLDAIITLLPSDETQEDAEGVRVALIGRPNVGKSQLTNTLLSKQRSIVTEISGTTRDAVDAQLIYNGQNVILVDTAGLRRRTKVHENIEFYATLRTERAIRNCDIAAVIIDATIGLEAQDIHVLKEAEDLMKGLIIVVNKWDLVEKETNTARDMERSIQERLQTLDYVPILFISALTGKRAHQVLDLALEIKQNAEFRIPTSELNQTMQRAIGRHHPPSWRGRHVQIKYVSQVRVKPPLFAFFCNHPQGVGTGYARYLENQLRKAYGFKGVPITLAFRRKTSSEKMEQ
ncbi:MAG: ribosome biogenesis GTPase Der [Bacteroidetes bacterium]|nr:ribosome biogenesis GTPase Der [Bacteroidota bacterium]